MAHFAKLNENNVVVAIHVVDNSVITINGIESEEAGINFLTGLHGHSLWKQTSYNSLFRKNYAGIGYFYNESLDAFIPEKPYDSWYLDESTCRWNPPFPHPNDGKVYFWDEPSNQWNEVVGIY